MAKQKAGVGKNQDPKNIKINGGADRNFKGVFTKEKQVEFCAALIESGYRVSVACEKIGISRQTYYYNLNWDMKFKEMVFLTKSFTKNVIRDSILEGLLHSDLTLRYKYLSTLPSSIIATALDMEEKDAAQLIFKLNKDALLKTDGK